MIRRLHGGEGSDATRFPIHLEVTGEATDQEKADEFRELLDRARGRAAAATDEVSALSMALAAAQAGALTQQPDPVIQREPSVSEAPTESCEESEEHLVQHDDSAAKTAVPEQTQDAQIQEDPSSTDSELAEQEDAGDRQPELAHEPVESGEKLELIHSEPSHAEPVVEEQALAIEEGLVMRPPTQSEDIQEGATVEKATPKVAAELTQRPQELEDAPQQSQALPAAISPETRVEGEKGDSPIPFGEEAEQRQGQFAKQGSELLQRNATSPTENTPNRASDMSIQLAILRQAFESTRGIGSSQPEGAAKRGMLSGQVVGAASEARSARGADYQKTAKPMTPVQIHRMLEKVESAMKEAARSRDGKTIRFRVEPFNVGEVKVDVSLREGLLHARLTAESPQVSEVLRDRAHELQSALRKLGLDVDNVTVTVSEEEDSRAPAGEQNLSDGKTFQEERNNMPGKEAQVVENSFGNKIAEVSEASTSRVTSAILDHWVA